MLFLRNESFSQFTRSYPIVTYIIGIHTVLFLLSVITPAFYFLYFHRLGIGYNAAVAAGEWWRLVTPIFLHGGFSHFILNSFSLVIFGPALERMLGHVRFLGAYLFAGIVGNLATFFLHPGHYLHLGASGAIYGLLGLYFYMKLHRKDLIDPQSAQIITIFLVIGLIYSFMPNINIASHLFGFLAGFLGGWIIIKRH